MRVWTKYTLTHTQFQVLGDTSQVEVFQAAQNQIITGVVMKHTVPFTGGTTYTSYTISVGPASSAQEYASNFDVLQMVSSDAHKSTIVQKIPTFGNVSVSVKATATADHSLNDSTAGSLDIWVETVTLP